MVDALESVGALARAGVAAPDSPFNVQISPYRRFAWVRGDLDDYKRIKNTVGGTVNDVVLAAVAGALGRFLRARGHATAGLELKAMIPISVRLAGPARRPRQQGERDVRDAPGRHRGPGGAPEAISPPAWATSRSRSRRSARRS